MLNYIRYFRYRIGLRRTIPAYFINKMPVVESDAPLVDISKNEKFRFDCAIKNRGGFFVRADVAEMLNRVADMLPKQFKLYFIHGYRSRAHQWLMWINKVDDVQKTYPDAPAHELERIARATIACPKNGYGPHQTGGAIDVTIADENDVPLDMGCAPLHLDVESATHYRHISRDARKNRQMLLRVMRRAGFNNYPAEWWHFSYGDRMWATYKHKRHAIYGPIDCNKYKLTRTEGRILAQHGIDIKKRHKFAHSAKSAVWRVL